MKFAILCALGVAFVSGTANATPASCISELGYRGLQPEQVLPSACRAMGPLRLGMSCADVIKILNVPDASMALGHDEEVLAYALPHIPYPRGRNPSATADPSNGFLRIILDKGKVVDLTALGNGSSAAPYTVGDIAIGEPVNRLLRSITAPPLWNTSQDNVILGAYPIEVGLDENTHQLISINIFTSWKDEGGPYPVFRDGAICLDGRAGIACPR